MVTKQAVVMMVMWLLCQQVLAALPSHGHQVPQPVLETPGQAAETPCHESAHRASVLAGEDTGHTTAVEASHLEQARVNPSHHTDNCCDSSCQCCFGSCLVMLSAPPAEAMPVLPYHFVSPYLFAITQSPAHSLFRPPIAA